MQRLPDKDIERLYEPERLDGVKEICRFIGISAWYYTRNLRAEFEDAGILLRQKRKMSKAVKIFTYKRLVIATLIKINARDGHI